MTVTRLFIRSFILIFSLFFLLNTTASAGSCKGLSKSKCKDSSSCKWVEGYETRKGDKVDSFCRKKNGKPHKEDKYKGMGEIERYQEKQKEELRKQGRELPADY